MNWKPRLPFLPHFPPHCSLLVCSSLLYSLPAFAQSQDAYSNFGPQDSYLQDTVSLPPLAGLEANSAALSFVAERSGRLESIDIAVKDLDGPSSPVLALSIHSDGLNQPGPYLASQVYFFFSQTTSEVFNFPISTPVFLGEGQKYWFSIEVIPMGGETLDIVWHRNPVGVISSFGYGSPFSGTWVIGSPVVAPVLRVNIIDPVGTAFCDPMDPNETGLPTVMSGTPSPGLGSGLTLMCEQGPPNQFGYFLSSQGAVSPGTPVGNGRLCIDTNTTGNFGRYNIAGSNMNSVGQFDPFGVLFNLSNTGLESTGFNVPTQLPWGGNQMISAGATVAFQFVHREPSGSINFSNGLLVSF